MHELAVCVPTYERAGYLEELVTSFLAGLPDSVQLVVSDNASADGTQLLMDACARHDDRVKYVRSPVNLGPDRNYLRAVEAADARYCWLFGSDDLPSPGALRRILAVISQTAPDILLFDRVWCDIAMRPLRGDAMFSPHRPLLFDTARVGGSIAYLDHAVTIMALFSYLSSIVVSKDRWDRTDPREEFVGSAYVHSARLLSVLDEGARLCYLPEALVRCRGDNDFFLEKGAFNRVRIDLAGYRRLNDTFFPHGRARAAALRVMRREYGALRLLLVLATADDGECDELLQYLEYYEYPPSLRRLLSLLSEPAPRRLLAAAAPCGRRAWWAWQAARAHHSP